MVRGVSDSLVDQTTPMGPNEEMLRLNDRGTQSCSRAEKSRLKVFVILLHAVILHKSMVLES